MWIWDGTDRREDDEEAAFADRIRRAMISSNPSHHTLMRAYVAAISLELTGRHSTQLTAPEPLIQGGFTPCEQEREEMCKIVERTGRDLVHICFLADVPCRPTGMMVVVYHNGHSVRLHSRSSIVGSNNTGGVRLLGVEDKSDTVWSFAYRRGRKLTRKRASMDEASRDAMLLASSRVFELAETGATGNAANEPLKFQI
jgi:hypothetical protein